MESNRTYQSRLGKTQDKLKRKLLGNTTSLLGTATDLIRIRVKLTKAGDKESTILDSIDNVPIVFPPLVDIPFRRISGENGEYKIDVLPSITDEEKLQVSCSRGDKLYVGDLLFRVFLEVDAAMPVVLAFEVVEALGTFGVNSMISTKFNLTLYSEKLPQVIEEYLIAMAVRRQYLGW
jgi:hypothetical protein